MGQQDPGDTPIKKKRKKLDPGGRARETFQELRFYCCKAASRSGAKVMMMMLRILMMTMMETQMMTMMMIAERAPPVFHQGFTGSTLFGLMEIATIRQKKR